jgi:hypothetical protein
MPTIPEGIQGVNIKDLAEVRNAKSISERCMTHRYIVRFESFKAIDEAAGHSQKRWCFNQSAGI